MGGKRRDFAVGVQFICFLLVCVATVKSDPVIPIFDKAPGILQIPENTPVNKVLGQLSLKGGQNLQIKSSNDIVKVEELENKNEVLTVNIILIQTPLDYDSGPHEYLLIFSGSNSDYQGILYKKTLYITDVNDEYPGLKNLPYNFDVAENQSPGIVVFNKIRASDPDQHDELEYSLTTNAQGADDGYKNKFTINSKTGDLTLEHSLDYETNRFYQYTITVKDKVGHNTTADIFITVTDVQDEPPSFTRESYKASIKEGTNIGTSVLTVKARDGDRGVPNSMIYTINSETCPGLFQLSSSTGELTVKKKADRDSGHPKQQNGICKLEIKAEEGTEHKQAKQGANTMAVVDVSITIEDVNDNRPMFSKGSFSGTVDENTQIGVPITLSTPISVEDKDQGKNAEFTVTLTNHQESFEVSPSLVQSSGNLMIRVKNSTILDYELQESLKIMLEAKETGTDGKTDTAVVNLTIKNVNDNSPQFSNFVSSANVTENANVDANVMTVKATDKDKNDDGNNFGTVEYSLVENDPFFKINKTTGLVQVASMGLDRETKDKYYLTVVAEDGGHIKETTQISISITDVNDNGPQFVTDDYQTSLAEQDKDFSRPVKVLATDVDQRDNPNSEIVYSIKSSTPTGLDKNFLINSTDGRISVASPLTYENIKFPPHQEGKIILTVMAEDRGTAPMNSTVNVVVSLQDVNNNAPKCEQHVYKTSVAENKAKSHFVQVVATDSDATAPNNRIMYTIDQTSADKFVMNSSSGELSTRVALDRENLESYNITVTVTDFGVPSKSGTCHVSVSVTDVNDESPVFQKKSISKSYPENTRGLVITNTANDEDTDHKLSYKIDWSKSTGINHLDQTVTNVSQSYFKIDSTTGKISLKKNLDRETIRLFTLHVTVEDVNSTDGSQKDTATVTVTVQDQNDEPPSFIDGNTYEAEILENMPPGSEINIKNKSLSVEDKDEGANSQFSLTLATHSADFSLTPSVGTGRETFTISVKNQTFLDYEKLEKFTIKIKAVDKHNPKLSNTATVTVRIINKNDNIPEFDGAPFTASVPEGNKNACFTTIKAHDDDKAPYGAILFSLPQKPPQFTINETSGLMCTNEALDREKQDSFSVSVKVRDSENFSSTTQLIVTVDDTNDNGPVFVNKKIQTDIDEGQPNFTPALNAQAKDDDKPGTDNSKIVYTLINLPQGLQSNFTINKDTGQITLQSPLDYESLNQNQRKGITLVVEAKDQGKPPRSSTVSLTVNVKDINDVKPTFPKDNYNIHISENASLNTEIIHLVAKDKDATSPNNIVSYSMDTLSASTFEIEPTNGIISLKTQLDREKNPAYKITVTAMDQGTPSLTATTVVHLVVDDVNDEKPSFSKGQNPIEIEENVMFQYNCSAMDPDENYNLQYQILWSESSGQDGDGKSVNSTELQKWIQINSTTCQLKSRKKLDREEVAMFSLVIEVKDLNAQSNKPQTDKVTLIINVKDENDAKPEFGEDSYVADIPENMPDGTEIPFTTAITVQDKDEGKNSQLKVELDSLEEFFSVSPKTVMGSERLTIKVTNSSLLDFEKNEKITLKIVATETQTQEKNSSTATITINIINKNDNMPEFVGAPFIGSVLENKKNGTSITTVKAEDKDSGTFGNVFFSLPENPIEFTINQTSGEVFTAKQMNREEKSSYTIIVRVQDGGNFYSTTQLTVTILDENDETPDFRNKIFATEIEENKPKFIPPFLVQAFDGDAPDTKNSEIVYSLQQPHTGLHSNFSINDTTGEITLNSVLDYEALDSNLNGVIVFVVQAKDQGKTHSNSASVSVTISVTDTNDEQPIFKQQVYQKDVLENIKSGISFTSVLAEDNDGTAPNNEVFYVIQSGGQDKFQINSTSGEIAIGVGSELDRETIDSFHLTVLAIDKGIPAQTSTTTVGITVKDVNDTPPKITSTVFSTKILENSTRTSEVMNITATDEDENFLLEYSILWNESRAFDERDRDVDVLKIKNWMAINSTTGTITVNSTLDRELVEQVVMKIQVKDVRAEMNTTQVATGTVTVSILDVNDNPPVISSVSSVLSLSVSEGTKVDTEVTTLSATDKDKEQDVQFHLAGSTSFNITETGKLILTKQLDRESSSTQEFTVIATDNGRPPQSSNISVKVEILDINDNDPEFIQNLKRFKVLENSNNQTIVANMSAKDKDSGHNANITFQFKDVSPFRIDAITGSIYVDGELDREKTSSYTLTVIAADNPLLEERRRASTVISIDVEDINDNPPEFPTSVMTYGYFGRLSETSKNTTVVSLKPAAISATDRDEGQNAKITFSFKNASNNYFKIDPQSGIVTVNKDNLKNMVDKYRYVVIASDQGTVPKTTEVNITIDVLDENINDPKFVDQGPIRSIPECIKTGVSVYKFKATDNDKDKSTNGRVQYFLDNSTTVDDWKYFNLDPDTGVLRVAKPLDSEDSSDLLIRVIARDMGEPPNQTPGREMKVKVTDVNDNPPRFKEGQKTDFSVKEGLEQTVIGKITAIDPDENATLKYEIIDLANEWMDFFKIETGPDKSGTIHLTKSLDHEEINFIKFKVNAKDDFITNVDEACGGTFQDAKSHTATPLEVSIKVEDVDDSPPVFSDDTISRGFLSGTEFGKTIIRLTDYVTDNDTAPFSVHGFYQVGELKADQQLQKGWSPTITSTPLKVNVNGSVVTNYKFSGDVFGAFTLKVLANDTAGNDTVNLKIYVVGDAQVVKMTFYYTEEQLRLLQEEIGRELSKLGYEVIPDNIQPYYKDDGTVDGSKSVLLLHAVDHTTGDIISGNQLLNELDSASNLISEILQRYKVLNTQLGTAARKSSANKDDTRTRYILISIIVIIAITFVITLYFLIHNIRRFKRKLKAATLEVHALDPIKQDMVPGLDDRIREANPIYMRDDLALDDGKYGIDDDSYDSLSLKSENSLDKNAIDSVQPARNMEPATDEQEMTLDMYGNDDPLAVNDLRPRGMNFLNQAFERHGEKYDDIDKKERDGRAENDDQSDEEDILNVDLSQFESTEI